MATVGDLAWTALSGVYGTDLTLTDLIERWYDDVGEPGADIVGFFAGLGADPSGTAADVRYDYWVNHWGVAVDELLLESGSFLLLESGDNLLMEA